MLPPDAGGGLLAMLGGTGGPMGTQAPADPFKSLDPLMFGQQAGEPPADPFASMPFQSAPSDQLIDQLEGMGLGAQPQAPPDLATLLGGGGPPPGLGGPPPGLPMGGPPGLPMGGPPGLPMGGPPGLRR